MTWNLDISTAPRGKTITTTRKVKTAEGVVDRSVEETRREYILAVHADGTVVQSYWIPPRYTQSGALLDGNRWSDFSVGRDPIAWAPWPVFDFAAASQGEAAVTAPTNVSLPVGGRSGEGVNAGGGHVTDGENAQPEKAGERVSSSPVPLIVHKHIFLDDCGSGA
jgi:hypothetical protein